MPAPPLLQHFSARLDCRMFDTVDAGDHDIFIGQVVAMKVVEETERPLVFHRGEFVMLDAGDASPA